MLPILIPPNEPPIEPELKAPTPVSEELTTAEPKVVASRTRALLMRKELLVGRFTFPAERVIPPEKVDVAELPTIVVVADPPTYNVSKTEKRVDDA